MDPQPEVIRQQIEQTRGSLTEKLEALEGQVRQTIGSVTSTVEQTVDTVKSKVEGTVQAVTSAVGETIDSVKRTFDIPHQVRRHPYAMTGGAFLLGGALGYALAARRRRLVRYPAAAERVPSYVPPPPPAPPPPAKAYEEPRRAAESREARPGFFAGLLEPVAGEFDKIKATALGAFLGVVRDAAVRWVPPSLVPKVEEIVNDITRRAGGDVVSGPVLSRGDGADS